MGIYFHKTFLIGSSRAAFQFSTRCEANLKNIFFLQYEITKCPIIPLLCHFTMTRAREHEKYVTLLQPSLHCRKEQKYGRKAFLVQDSTSGTNTEHFSFVFGKKRFSQQSWKEFA